MGTLGQILGLLAIIIPFLITIYNRWFSKKAAEKKRRAEEDKKIHEDKKREQEIARTEGKIHDKQDLIEKVYLLKQKTKIKYKVPKLEKQLNECPLYLQYVAYSFGYKSNKMGIQPVVTRVTDPIEGESGVHPVGRAIDFRDEYLEKNVFNENQIKRLVKEMNEEFPRTDGKKVCIHHSFDGGPYHFHLQIPVAWT